MNLNSMRKLTLYQHGIGLSLMVDKKKKKKKKDTLSELEHETKSEGEMSTSEMTHFIKQMMERAKSSTRRTKRNVLGLIEVYQIKSYI